MVVICYNGSIEVNGSGLVIAIFVADSRNYGLLLIFCEQEGDARGSRNGGRKLVARVVLNLGVAACAFTGICMHASANVVINQIGFKQGEPKHLSIRDATQGSS
jgi:hypothetical protein